MRFGCLTSRSLAVERWRWRRRSWSSMATLRTCSVRLHHHHSNRALPLYNHTSKNLISWLEKSTNYLEFSSSSNTIKMYKYRNTDIQKCRYTEIQICGTAAVGVRLHLDHSPGPFTDLPQYQMLQYSDLSRQHSFGHGTSAQQIKETGRAQWLDNWSAVTASAAV